MDINVMKVESTTTANNKLASDLNGKQRTSLR